MEHKFRRPAMLDPDQAEEIVGDQDPAEGSDLAHSTAWALMAVPTADFDVEAILALKEVVRRQGIDVVAETWSRSPEFTLPGALWRIFLVWQWNHVNPEIVQERYRDGIQALEERGIVDQGQLPQVDEVLLAIDAVLNGYATDDDLAPVFETTADLLRVLGAGVRFGPEWITSDEHALAHEVTRRPRALLATSDELEESARQARSGTLN